MSKHNPATEPAHVVPAPALTPRPKLFVALLIGWLVWLLLLWLMWIVTKP